MVIMKTFLLAIPSLIVAISLGFISAQTEMIYQQRKAIIDLTKEGAELDRQWHETLIEGVETLSDLRACEETNDHLVEDLENYDMQSQWEIEDLEEALYECRRERGPR